MLNIYLPGLSEIKYGQGFEKNTADTNESGMIILSMSQFVRYILQAQGDTGLLKRAD